MGLEIENPQEFLTNALSMVTEYHEITENLSKNRELEKQDKKNLDAFQKDTREKIEKTLKSRGEEIAATYDRQLSQIDGKIKKTQQLRDKAKNQGIKGRIEAETEELHQENKDLHRQMIAVLKKDGAPGFCKTKLFYTLFKPGTFGEFLGLIVSFFVIFAAIPIGIYLFILPERRTLWLILIYLLDILIFGGLYVFIGNRTTGRHREAIQQGQEIRKRIRQNNRKIKTIIKGIRGDANEEGYHLEEFDDELARAQQDRNEIIAKKQSAQNTFENVTKNIITDEIEAAAKPKLTELSEKLSSVQSTVSELETKEKDMSMQLSRDYEQFLGKSHMNEKDIQAIRNLLDNQQASSLIDAVSKLEHPEQLEVS